MQRTNALRVTFSGANVVAAVVLAMAAPVWAQVTDAPIKDLTPRGMRQPPPTPPNLPPPNADAHDFNGAYASMGGGPGGPPGGPGGPPGSAGPGGPPPGPPPTRPKSNDRFVECMPSVSVGSAGSPGLIVQTPGRFTFIAEGNNEVRRIYMDSQFPEKLMPSRMGYSVGHWEGDTLVIETRGLKTNAIDPGMASITKVIERMHKTDGGKTIETSSTIEGLDSSGKAATANRKGSMTWRPDMVPIEVTCEEGQDYSFE